MRLHISLSDATAPKCPGSRAGGIEGVLDGHDALDTGFPRVVCTVKKPVRYCVSLSNMVSGENRDKNSDQGPSIATRNWDYKPLRPNRHVVRV